MRAASRLLASVQRGTQFLEPGAPTGLTGLLTHAHPRSTLLYHYNSTLEKLKLFPEHSAYRQSTEALTKHRMSIVESVRPAGLEEWQGRVASTVEGNTQAFRKIPSISSATEYNIVWKAGVQRKTEDERSTDEYKTPLVAEGPAHEEERQDQARLLSHDPIGEEAKIPHIESEPPLSAEQINDIEGKIGAGLIEEVIQVAEAESALADTLLQNQVWEDLEEKPAANQWTYAERDTHTKETQAP